MRITTENFVGHVLIESSKIMWFLFLRFNSRKVMDKATTPVSCSLAKGKGLDGSCAVNGKFSRFFRYGKLFCVFVMWGIGKTRRGAGDLLVKLLSRRPRAIVDTITCVKITC